MNHQQPQSDEPVTLTVGGIKYETITQTLARYPETLLGQMYKDSVMKRMTGTNNYAFDRDEEEKLNDFISMLVEIGLKLKWFMMEYKKKVADVDVMVFDGKSDESHCTYGKARAYRFQVDGFTLLTEYQKEIQDRMKKIAPKLNAFLEIEKKRATIWLELMS
ncbi:7861_t:CDS:2 [Ambispora gerdemannii]|uniref:7861_t:CDS:1 n=1 Tax=Ambispora gerdemannii TaxID=144530 RepID=A0A9N8YPR5_9GLOM|nr:7861_t:CDS:2 [Ambispora gerdemannii]